MPRMLLAALIICFAATVAAAADKPRLVVLTDIGGARGITSVVDRDGPRPVNVTIWGGSTELAQALWRARNDRTPEQLKKFLGKLRVYSIGHHDDTGPSTNENFPDLFFILA